MENDLSKAYVEILEILSHMEQKYVDKIPQKLLELFNEEKDKDYKIEINPNISLTEQNLQRKTLALLAMLNLNYWCENEEEKQEILKMYADNDKKIEVVLVKIRGEIGLKEINSAVQEIKNKQKEKVTDRLK